MNNDKRNKHLLEQIKIQKIIIDELNKKIKLLEETNELVQENVKNNQQQGVEICKKCGKLFLFTSSLNCCI
jgi:hypothetical protein